MSERPRPLYSFGPFHLDPGEQLLLREGEAVPLRPKVFDLLVALVESRGHLVSKDELMKQVWANSFVEENNLTVSMSNLRTALGENRKEHPYIETVSRRGYRFVASVTEEPARQATQTKVYATNATPGAGRARRVTLAVLPFKPIGELGDEHLSLGMADALITRLSNLRGVIVRPTSSVRKYNGTQDPVLAGKELRVEWVLDGSVQRSGQLIRVTAQLVSVLDGVSRWAEKFDEEFTKVFVAEDSMSERLTKALARELMIEQKRRLLERYTTRAAA